MRSHPHIREYVLEGSLESVFEPREGYFYLLFCHLIDPQLIILAVNESESIVQSFFSSGRITSMT